MANLLLLCVGTVLLAQLALCLDFIGDLHLGGVDGVNIVDHCDPNNHVNSSCDTGKCCVKEALFYIPEATGPKPAYRISCKPLLEDGAFCMTGHSTEMCPCMAGLTCKRGTFGSFGHCHHGH